MRATRVLENNDAATVGRSKQFEAKNVVAGKNGVFHCATGNAGRFDQEEARKQKRSSASRQNCRENDECNCSLITQNF
jgi:hypothetical protein